MLNKVILTGRLVADAELRYTPSNKAVATARIACPRDFKNQNGERESDFFPLVIWGKYAESFSNWIKKGYLVTVEGRLQTRSYENQQGQKVYVTRLMCQTLTTYSLVIATPLLNKLQILDLQKGAFLEVENL